MFNTVVTKVRSGPALFACAHLQVPFYDLLLSYSQITIGWNNKLENNYKKNHVEYFAIFFGLFEILKEKHSPQNKNIGVNIKANAYKWITLALWAK